MRRAAISASGFWSASSTTGTSSASSVATAIPTLTREYVSMRPSTYEALNRGSSRSVLATALTTKSLSDGTSSPPSRAPRRSATISETSTSAAAVRTGVVVADSVIRRAIVASVGVSSRVVTSPFPAVSRVSGAAASEPAAALTSSTVTRPPGPVPAMPWSETPSSTATRLATGEAFGREPALSPSGDRPSSAWPLAGEGSSVAAGGDGVASPLVSPSPFDSVAIASPTPAVPPSATRIAASLPSHSAS